jgi:membrane associated rhomboid family serine protease
VFVTIETRSKLRLPWATPSLLAIMVALAVWGMQLQPNEKSRFMRSLGTIPSELARQLRAPDWNLLDLISAQFVHIDFAHLLGNALFLSLFGIAVERVFRSRLVLLLFLLCGIISNVSTALLIRELNAPIIGASGAVSGLIGAYLYLFPRASLGIVIPLGLYFHTERVPAPVMIGLWFFLQILFTFTSSETPTIAWLSHVIGFVSGFVLAVLLRPLFFSSARSRLLDR